MQRFTNLVVLYFPVFTTFSAINRPNRKVNGKPNDTIFRLTMFTRCVLYVLSIPRILSSGTEPIAYFYSIRGHRVKAPPDRREILAATAKLSLRILSWTGTYTATSGSPHTGPKKSRGRLRNCSDLFTVAACTVFVAVAAYSAGFTFQFRELAPAGDKKILWRQTPESRSRQVSFLFAIH